MTDELPQLSLSQAPLTRVLCQLSWPELAWFKADEVAGRLGESIGRGYPLLETQQEAQLIITPQGVTQHGGKAVHRYLTADRSWIVSLGSRFLSLESVSYRNHSDFITRLGDVWDELLVVAPVPYLTRLGYRYTNRIDQRDDLEQLDRYFKPEILGAIASGQPESLIHSASESVYTENGGMLIVRTALLGPNASIDPGLPSVDTRSWILDLDAYAESIQPEGLKIDAVRQLAQAQADRARRRFRELITSDFEDRFK